MASFSTTFPHLAEGQGLLLTGEVPYTPQLVALETLLGIGQLEPEQDYALTKNTNVLQKQPNGEYVMDGNGQIATAPAGFIAKNKQETTRNAVFIFAPNENGALLFRNENEFVEDDQSRLNKILKAIEKIKRFNMVGYNSQGVVTPYYAVFLDTPNKDPSRSSTNYFHQDEPAGDCLELSVKKALQESGITHVVPSPTSYPKRKQSKYTCIEYGNECLSTTVKNPYIPGDIIRFVACPGTVLCVENTSQQHSTPFDTSAYTSSESITDPVTQYQTSYTGFDRGPGNQYLQQTVPSGRKLYRTQYVPVTLEEAQIALSKLQQGKDYVFISLESVMPAYHALDPFGSMPMIDYVNNPAYRTQERGGSKRKKKMSRRLKKMSNKKPRKSKKNRN